MIGLILQLAVDADGVHLGWQSLEIDTGSEDDWAG